MYIYVYIYIHVCTYKYVYIYLHIYIYVLQNTQNESWEELGIHRALSQNSTSSALWFITTTARPQSQGSCPPEAYGGGRSLLGSMMVYFGMHYWEPTYYPPLDLGLLERRAGDMTWAS